MSMVSTSVLAIAMTTYTTGATLHLCFFFESAAWVVATIATAQDADILPAVCRVHRDGGVTTFGDALLTAGSSSSLPTNESERYSSMH
jgi:hypothetical protein